MYAGVLEAAAIGVTDPKSGEAVELFVVRKDAQLTEQTLLEHCRMNLTAYKLPKIIEFREEPLPKSSIGKILLQAVMGADAGLKSQPAGRMTGSQNGHNRTVGDSPQKQTVARESCNRPKLSIPIIR